MQQVDAVSDGPRPPFERPGHDLKVGSRIEADSRTRRMKKHVRADECADDQRRQRATDAQSGAPSGSDAIQGRAIHCAQPRQLKPDQPNWPGRRVPAGASTGSPTRRHHCRRMVPASPLPARDYICDTLRPSSPVRTLVQATVVLVALVGLAFGLQAALLKVPSRAQLLAVEALKALSRYHVMSGTEQMSWRPRASICLENRVFDTRTESVVLGSFVLVGKRQQYYDLGHGVHIVGPGEPTYRVARNRFLLAGCPGFLVERLGTLLSIWRQVQVTAVQADGVPAFRIHFGRARLGVELYVERLHLRPLELALGPGASAPRSDLEPSLVRNQGELAERVVPTALRSRFRRG